MKEMGRIFSHEPRRPGTGLVLFDIDGTLLRRAGPHHREALAEAVRRVTGLETTTDGIPVQGMLDRDILAAMLAAAGAPPALVRRKMLEMVTIAQSVYERRCPDLRRKVCPGARMLLYRLSRRGVPAADKSSAQRSSISHPIIACGKASRSACAAGSVWITSPIALSRTISSFSM